MPKVVEYPRIKKAFRFNPLLNKKLISIAKKRNVTQTEVLEEGVKLYIKLHSKEVCYDTSRIKTNKSMDV